MDIIIDDLGDEKEAEIVSWLVVDGATVETGQPVIVVETGKATLEIEAPMSGQIAIVVPEGQVVETGAIVGRVQ